MITVAVQMDALSTLNPLSDSTLILIREALRRNYSVFAYGPENLSQSEGAIVAEAKRLFFSAEETKTKSNQGTTLPKEIVLEEKETTTLDLSSVDVVLIRQDPPYDMHYLTTCYLLEKLPDSVTVLNNPTSVRAFPEKIWATDFSEFFPPSLITRSKKSVEDFLKKHPQSVIKDLFGFGGAGVFKLFKEDPNKNSIISLFLEQKDFFMVQKFLPNVTAGDKRILFIDGECIGGINRIPPKGQILSNLAQGGSAVKTDLSEADKAICSQLSPLLKQHGLFFVGIDVIDGHLTEINITSPTGIGALAEFTHTRPDVLFWDKLEK